MSKTVLSVAAIALLLSSAPLLADDLVLRPKPADLYDLDHGKYYTWGLSTEQDISLVVVSGAVLRFDDIRNWDNSPNVLYVHLLDAAPGGVTTYSDGQGGGDNFAGQGIELVTYRDLTTQARDLEYVFTNTEVDAFNAYLQNGSNVALGFDPDCHFWNEGVSLEFCYDVVPEPTCAALVVLGAVATLRRRRARR